MVKNMAEAVMHPARQRIAQYMATNGSCTVNALAAALPDIPRPSLYRHMQVLLGAGIVEILSEKTVRGAVEKTYGLVRHSPEEYTRAEMGALFCSSLMALAASFSAYFAEETADPARDLLGVSACSLALSDAEYTKLLQDISALYAPHLENKPTDGRRLRCLTLVSSPNQKEGESL